MGGPLPLGPITPSTEVLGQQDRTSAIGAPTSLVIDAIGVRSAVVPLGRNPDNTMQVPDRFDQTGWYTGGPQPGQFGPAVIAGHVDSYTGPAVFFRLKDLKPGDVVTVIGSLGRAEFRVDSVREFVKDNFPSDLVFGPTPDRALRLITCGGSYDRAARSYRDNVVAFASESTTGRP
jgi:sortase (surface protein transpeptidase)